MYIVLLTLNFVNTSKIDRQISINAIINVTMLVIFFISGVKTLFIFPMQERLGVKLFT